MKRVLHIAFNVVVGVLSLLGIAFIALIIYYYPVIDRVYIQPCNYYPEAFKDCK